MTLLELRLLPGQAGLSFFLYQELSYSQEEGAQEAGHMSCHTPLLPFPWLAGQCFCKCVLVHWAYHASLRCWDGMPVYILFLASIPSS